MCVSFQVDEKALKHITEMGFSKEAARQALMDNSNNLEAALNFLLNSSKQKPLQGPPPRGITWKEMLQNKVFMSKIICLQCITNVVI